MRKAEITRKTAETDITLSLNLDGSGKSSIDTGCGFLDHCLTLFSKHSSFDLTVTCKGDTEVDFHHSVEDVGICLGEAFLQAAGDLRGICRYGNMLLPMDEALLLAVVDVSGRGFLAYDLQIPATKVGDFDTELTEEFFIAFARNAKVTLHLKQLSGKNSHHIIEGVFKAFARSLKAAMAIDQTAADEIPSTKGVLV